MTKTKTQDNRGNSALWGKFFRSTQVYVWVEPRELSNGTQSIHIMLPKDRAGVRLGKWRDSAVDTTYVASITEFCSTLYNVVSKPGSSRSSYSKNRLLRLAMTPLAETCLQLLRLKGTNHTIGDIRRNFPLEDIFSEIMALYNANPAPKGF
jgi:hypothetical protein